MSCSPGGRTRGNVVAQIGERLDIQVRRGVTVGPYKHTFKKADGSIFDLTGCTVSGQVRSDDELQTLLATFTVNMPNPQEGWYTFEIPADETVDIPPGTYKFDTEMLMADGSVVPVFYGVFSLTVEVTR